MKITDRISGLVMELSQYESYESVDKLIVQDELSLKNILGLFCETDNASSKSLIHKILNEAGYGWFDRANPDLVKQSLEEALLEESQGARVELDLMRMLPANTYLH